MIELKNVSKSFDTAEGKVDALKDVSITIEDGDIYGIIGMSGAGKSTLVRCINMLEKPTSGEVIVNGKRLDTMSPAQLRAARRNITMIFQQFNLLMQRNCLKNVCFPMELAGASKKDAQNRAKELLALVGLPDKAKAYPAQLSVKYYTMLIIINIRRILKIPLRAAHCNRDNTMGFARRGVDSAGVSLVFLAKLTFRV